jgi:hypothetical protein
MRLLRPKRSFEERRVRRNPERFALRLHRGRCAIGNQNAQHEMPPPGFSPGLPGNGGRGQDRWISNGRATSRAAHERARLASTSPWPCRDARDCYRVFGSGCRVCRRLCCIKLAVTLLDPSRTEMALHCDAYMVRAIVGARQVKLLSCLAGSQSQNTLA